LPLLFFKPPRRTGIATAGRNPWKGFAWFGPSALVLRRRLPSTSAGADHRSRGQVGPFNDGYRPEPSLRWEPETRLFFPVSNCPRVLGACRPIPVFTDSLPSGCRFWSTGPAREPLHLRRPRHPRKTLTVVTECLFSLSPPATEESIGRLGRQ